MSDRRGPIAAFLAADEPTLATATAALRLVFLGLFAGQIVIALAIGLIVSALLPSRPSANDAFAIVLLIMAALHLPLAWALAAGARRAGGKQGALSSTVLAGVLSAVPAWFASLMLISGQRPLYLLLVMVLLALAYPVGFLTTGGAAAAATKRDGGEGEATP